MSLRRVGVHALLLLAVLATPLRAQAPAQPAPANVVDRGVINSAPYYIEIPAQWNKGLVLYTHGYAVASDKPRSQEYAPPKALRDVFLSRGFAFASSAARSSKRPVSISLMIFGSERPLRGLSSVPVGSLDGADVGIRGGVHAGELGDRAAVGRVERGWLFERGRGGLIRARARRRFGPTPHKHERKQGHQAEQGTRHASSWSPAVAVTTPL